MKFPRPTQHIKGAGDAVHLIAAPIAAAVDAVAGTKLKSCGGCAARRQDWNRRFPFVRARRIDTATETTQL